MGSQDIKSLLLLQTKTTTPTPEYTQLATEGIPCEQRTPPNPTPCRVGKVSCRCSNSDNVGSCIEKTWAVFANSFFEADAQNYFFFNEVVMRTKDMRIFEFDICFEYASEPLVNQADDIYGKRRWYRLGNGLEDELVLVAFSHEQ